MEHQEKYRKSAIERMKELLQTRSNSIDKLLCDKLADYYLIEEQPTPIIIGDKVIYVGCLTMDNYNWFLRNAAEIFASIGTDIFNFETLGNGADLLEVLINHEKVQKRMKWLIKNTILKQQEYYFKECDYDLKKAKLKKCTWRHFKKLITIEKLIQILFLIYAYNFDAVKKNLFIIAEKMGVKVTLENFMYSWLMSLGGVTGKFGLALWEKPDYWEDESQKAEMLEVGVNSG